MGRRCTSPAKLIRSFDAGDKQKADESRSDFKEFEPPQRETMTQQTTDVGIGVMICAFCPRQSQDEVLQICKQNKIVKAFGNSGTTSEWIMKVCAVAVAMVEFLEASHMRILCIEEPETCGEYMAAQHGLLQAIRAELQKQTFPISVEWMPHAIFKAKFDTHRRSVSSQDGALRPNNTILDHVGDAPSGTPSCDTESHRKRERRRRSSSRTGNQRIWQAKVAVAEECVVAKKSCTLLEGSSNAVEAGKSGIVNEIPIAQDTTVTMPKEMSVAGGECDSESLPVAQTSSFCVQDVHLVSDIDSKDVAHVATDLPLTPQIAVSSSPHTSKSILETEKPLACEIEEKRPTPSQDFEEQLGCNSRPQKQKVRKSLPPSATLSNKSQKPDIDTAVTLANVQPLTEEWPDLAKASQIRSRGTSRLRNHSATRQDRAAVRCQSQPRQWQSSSTTRGMQPRRDPLAIVWICKECQARFSRQDLLAEHQETEGHWSPTLECSRTFVRKSDLPSSGGYGAPDVDSGLAPGTSPQAIQTSAKVKAVDDNTSACFFAMSPRGEH